MTHRHGDVCALNAHVPDGAPLVVEHDGRYFTVSDSRDGRVVLPGTCFYAVVWAFIDGYRLGMEAVR